MEFSPDILNWMASQQSSFALLHFTLFLCLGVSVLAFFSPLLRSDRSKAWSLFVLGLFCIIEAFVHIEHALPFFDLEGSTWAIYYTNAISLLIYSLLVCVCAREGASLLKIRQVKTVGLVFLLGSFVLGCVLLLLNSPEDFAHQLSKVSSIVTILSGCLFIMSYAEGSLKDRNLYIGMVWVLLGIFHLFAWSDIHISSSTSPIEFLLQIFSMAGLFLIILLVDIQFVKFSNPSSLKRFLTRFIFVLQWGVLFVFSILASQFNSMMFHRKADEMLKMVKDKVYSLKYKLFNWQEHDIILTELLAKSHDVVELIKGNESVADNVEELLSIYVEGIGGGLGYLMDKQGNVVLSSKDIDGRTLTGNNYSYRPYFQDAMMGFSGVQYVLGATTSRPGLYTSSPIWGDFEVEGVAVLKKTLDPAQLEGVDDFSLIFDKNGDPILSLGGLLPVISLNNYKALSLDSRYFLDLQDSSTFLFKYADQYYFFSNDWLYGEDVSVAVASVVSSIFVYQAGLYSISALAIFFVFIFFVFVRYIIVRGQRDLEHANEFKTILDCTPNCISIIDKDLNTRRMDGQGIPFLGHMAEDFAGKSFVDIWSADKQFSIANSIRRAFAGDRMSFEGKYFHPDGYELFFFVVCGPIYDAAHNVKEVVAIWVDITHIKKVERELLDHLELEKALSHITSEFIASTDTRLAFSNSLEHILKLSGADRVLWYENEDGPDGTTQANLILNIVNPGFPSIPQDERLLRVGGDPLWLDWSLRMLKNRPVEICVNSTARPEDITYARAHGAQSMLMIPLINSGRWFGFVRFDRCFVAEKWLADKVGKLRAAVHQLQENIFRSKAQKTLNLLEAAVRSATEGMIITSKPFTGVPPRIVFANPSMCRMSGYSQLELTSMDLKSFEQENYGNFEDIVELVSQNNAFKTTYPRKNRAGEEYLVECGVYPIKNVSGDVTHYLFMHRDITEEHELQSRASLSSKLESIGQLAAGIAHEINTPAQFISDNLYFIQDNWNKLKGDVENLKKEVAESRAKQLDFIIGEMPGAISDALEGVDRISTIVQAMREFSHSGGMKARANLNKAIETTVTVARNEWKYCAEIDLKLEGNMPQLVCHVADINQVVLNLIVNAAHTIKDKIGTSPQKGTITIETSFDETFAYIKISDTGMGIPDSVKAKIYDPFFTTKGVGDGTGQGLFLAHRVIVERHNGDILCESEEGEGTTFILKIPFDQSHSPS